MSEQPKAYILYVDDDRDDQHIFREAMQAVRPDLLCKIASDGYEALKLLETTDLPICIYLDINMPMMDGLEVLGRIKENALLSAIPVFILSTSRSPMSEKRAMDLGATDYLVKPNTYGAYVDLLGACFVAHFPKN